MSDLRFFAAAALTAIWIASGASTLHAGTPTSDLAVTKTDGVVAVVPGEPITYTIVATNRGPDDATAGAAVTVTDTFPATLTGCTWTCTASAGSSCTAAGVGDIADSADLLATGTATYTATCTIDPAATGMLDNTATVATTNDDPDMTDNSATDSNTLSPTSDSMVTVDVSPMTPVVGEPFTVTVTVDNAGPSDATGVVVTLTLPAGVTVDGTTGCTEDPNGVPTCTLGTIPAPGLDRVSAGSSAMATFDLTAPAVGSDGSIVASVLASGVDPVGGNNTDTVAVTFAPATALVEVPVAGLPGLALLALLLGSLALLRLRRL